jgi:hypothetical protein
MEFGKRVQTPKAGTADGFTFGNVSPSAQHKTVVIGHGLSGRETVKAILKEKGHKTAITVINPNNFYESDVVTPFALKRPDLYEKVSMGQGKLTGSKNPPSMGQGKLTEVKPHPHY